MRMWEEKGNRTPCKDCADRHDGCHAGCEKYQKYIQNKHEKQEALKKWKRDTFKLRMDDPGIMRKDKKRPK